MNEDCPRCFASFKYIKSTLAETISDNDIVLGEVCLPLFYCTICKMAWRSLDETKPSAPRVKRPSESTHSTSSPKKANNIPSCDGCQGAIEKSMPTYSCSQHCGKAFHVTCMTDPLKDNFVCGDCAGKGSIKDDIRNSKRLISHMLDESEDEHFSRIMKTSWPVANQRLYGFEEYDEMDSLLFSDFEEESKEEVGSSTFAPVINRDEEKEEYSFGRLMDVMSTLQSRLFEDGSISAQGLGDLSNSMKNSIAHDSKEKLEKLIKFVFTVAKNSQGKSKRMTKGAITALIVRGARAVAFPESVIQCFSARSSSATEEPSPVTKKKVSAHANPYQGKSALVSAWSVDEVSEYISDLGFPQVVDAIKENEVDGSTFLSLSFEELQDDLGVEDESTISTILRLIAEMHSIS